MSSYKMDIKFSILLYLEVYLLDKFSRNFLKINKLLVQTLS
jgi:hypothetical protein